MKKLRRRGPRPLWGKAGLLLMLFLPSLSFAFGSWERIPENVSILVAAGFSGAVGSVNVSFSGNETAYFNVSVMGDTNITVQPGNFSLENGSLMQVNLSYSTNAGGGMHYTTILIDSTASPSQLNSSVSLNSVDFSVGTNATRISNVTAGRPLAFFLNASANGIGLDNSSGVEFSVAIGGSPCTIGSINYSSGFWMVNCSAPDIPGNPINNSLVITGTYRNSSYPNRITSNYSAANMVEYRDIASPVFSSIAFGTVNWTIENGTVNASVRLTVNVSDNLAVDSVWAIVHIGEGERTELLNYSLGLWSVNITNITAYGDYTVDVYANDSSANIGSNSSWFGVFEQREFSGVVQDKLLNNVSVNFSLYRPGTGTLLYRINTTALNASYNITVPARIYDLQVQVFGQMFRFLSTDLTNVSSPAHFVFDSFSGRGSQVSISSYPINKYVTGIYSNTSLIYTDLNLSLDYSYEYNTTLAGDASFYEEAVRVYRCQLWVYPTTCASGWSELSGTPEKLNATAFAHRIGALSPSTSLFVVAEKELCGNGFCRGGESCNSCSADCGSCPPASFYIPSSGGGLDVSTTVCGNGKCELGESAESCPKDCKKNVTCGNGVCESGESKDNCAADCGVKEAAPFSVQTPLSGVTLSAGENSTYPIWVTNNLGKDIKVSLETEGDAKNFTFLKEPNIVVGPKGMGNTDVIISAGWFDMPGTYTGRLVFTGENATFVQPYALVLQESRKELLGMDIEMLTPMVMLNTSLNFYVSITNNGLLKAMNLSLMYLVKDGNGTVYTRVRDNVSLEGSYNSIKEVPLTDPRLVAGEYYLEAVANYGNKNATATTSFIITKPFWNQTKTNTLLIATAAVTLVITAYYAQKWNKKRRSSRQRYLQPIDYKKLPQETPGALWIGKIAETNKKAYLNPNDLTTHALVTGATGSGKSVAASIVIEAALNQNIPVIVFDPTAQWTGFVKPCKDTNILQKYPEFGMTEDDAKPYKGNIIDVISAKQTEAIDLTKHTNPGEITVYTMDKLQKGDYDLATQNIITKIFTQKWEETPNLRMLVVFDEVHRLLEKYGGSGGYTALEKACREFRKWGIGLIMISQVNADFKEAISGNILTEVQLNTKSIDDVKKIEEKYGAEYASRTTKLAVGVAMIQNPRYNDGKPWYVALRPPQHNPHKIPAQELETYQTQNKMLEEIEQRIAAMKQSGVDTFDLELELKLAKNKLKEGRFKMSEIYVTSLKKRIGGAE